MKAGSFPRPLFQDFPLQLWEQKFPSLLSVNRVFPDPWSPGEVTARAATKTQFSISSPSAALWAHPACFLTWESSGIWGCTEASGETPPLFLPITLHHPKDASQNIQSPLAVPAALGFLLPAGFPVLQNCSATLWAHPAFSRPGNLLGFGVLRTHLGSAGHLQSRGKYLRILLLRISPEDQPGHTQHPPQP